ncbi:MAG: nucleotidyltransferase domain-containing protein [Desulfomonilia bacterium]|jgi:predicted nucleotidyltransferase
MMRNNKLPPDILDKIPSLIGKLQDIDSIDALYLFGSAAKKNLKPLSDIDIAVLISDELNKDEIESIKLALIGLIAGTLSTEEFDLVILNDAPIRFSYIILKDGDLVFVKNESHLIEFREKVVKYYLDFSYYLKKFNKAFLDGVGYHG